MLDASKLRPGQSKSATLTITGEGDMAGAYTLSKAGLSGHARSLRAARTPCC